MRLKQPAMTRVTIMGVASTAKYGGNEGVEGEGYEGEEGVGYD